MRTSAFTLVELSIVLVILGLLVGGVLSGQALIRAAELRTITTERDRVLTTLHTFRDKYMALPGDMPNAFAFWGTDCGTDDVTPGTGCNGNGNGFIETDGGENLKTWEHLSRAGLIEGQFDGTGVDEGYCTYGCLFLTPANTLASKFPQGFWNFNEGGDDAVGMLTYPNVQLNLGTIQASADRVGVSTLPTLALEEAYNIDRKADDGWADTGTLRGDGGVDCRDTGTDAYNIATLGADTTNLCILHFIVRP